MDAKNLSICFAPTVILPKNISDDPTTLMETPTVTSHLAWIVENVDEVFPVCSDPFPTMDILPVNLDKSIEENSPVESPLIESNEIEIPKEREEHDRSSSMELIDSYRDGKDDKTKKSTESDPPEPTKSEDDRKITDAMKSNRKKSKKTKT
jgi:hypothetical protein